MLELRKLAGLCAPLLLSMPALGQAGPDDQRLDELLNRLADLELAIGNLKEELEPEASSASSPAERMQAFEQHMALQEHSPFKDRRWHHLGPTNTSGRVTDVAIGTPRGESYTVFIATASGGVWKTENEGVTWQPIFDDQASQSIGDLALAPSDQQQLWVGTGEANIFRSSMAGNGVYRSMDGGKTFEHKGLAGTHTISRIVVHPEDPNTVYVAASGHEWTNNAERGVYRTTDGGES